MQTRHTIRAIAAFEAFKGALVLAAGLGLLSLLHRDLHDLAVRLVHHAHLNPASRYPQIFIDAAGNLQNSKLVTLAAGAAMYAAVRFLEAFGLFRGDAWAEVLAAGSGAIYVPFEVLHLVRHPTGLSALLFAANVAVVVVMVRALLQRRNQARSRPAGPDRVTLPES